MDIESFRDFCLQQKGAEESLPFGPETLVFKVMNKIFALAVLDKVPLRVNLKCSPERAVQLRETYDEAILPGYHMNKKHWNTLVLNQLPPKLIRQLILHSYRLVIKKLPKTKQKELQQLDG